MYIQKVKLQNFRSFGDEGICFLFNKGINAVIGENNNGKTALIDAIRIAFSCVLYKKDIFFSKTDFHVNAAGERAAFAQIDVYLKDVPQNLIEIWDPIQSDCGEIHVVFTLEKTAAGTDKVKYRAWGGKCEGNLLSSDTLEAINLDYLSALRDASSEMKPSRNSKLAELLETIAKEPKDKEALVDKLRTANQEILQTESLGKTKQVINENLFSIEQDLMYQKVDLGLVEPRFESITASLRTWIVPRWCFMGEDHQKYGDKQLLKSDCNYRDSNHSVQFVDLLRRINKIWNGYSLGSLRNCYENKCHSPCDCYRNLARDAADYRFQLWSKAISSGTGGLHACNKVESCCFHYCFYRISIFPAIYHFTIRRRGRAVF